MQKFVEHFSNACTPLSKEGSSNLRDVYTNLRPSYTGKPLTGENSFDAELIESSIAILKRGKAVDLDCLSAEHFHFCHPLLPTVLSKLFNIMISAGHVPPSFCYSYTVPLVKSNYHAFSKSLRVQDFRGISISSVLSKIFEHCILNRFADFLISSDNQFGFKKKMGCTQAIYSMRRVIEQYTMNGSTVNICALDLTKAFDKMNHHGLFIKLMKRNIPVQVLSVIEYWFRSCYTCVKWASSVSCFFKLECGVRQGGGLSPYFLPFSLTTSL